MATESSAVVRFISLAQQSQHPVLPTPAAPITSEFGTEVIREVRRKPSRAPLVIGALVLAVGAAAGGVILGKSGFGGSDGPNPAAAPAKAAGAAPMAAADRDQAMPATPAAPEVPAAAATAPEPQVTSPVVSTPAEVLAATGFDIRVQPGATVTLDGSVLGKAPLRVRNLQPGAHVVDIEAPPGYFSRRLEVALNAGEAKDLRLSLDPIEADASSAAATAAASNADEPKAKARPSRRSSAELRRERKEKVRQEAERKKEMRAARVAAAKAAKTDRDKKPAVVAEPLSEEPKATKEMDAADVELEAAMAEITGKPGPKRSGTSAAGASSLSASDPGSVSGKGTLMLGSKPPCDIILDGKPTGLKTPQRAMELSAGTHQIVLVNPELGIEKKFKVKIAPGKTTKAIQDLTDKLD
jgi:hypothetical protein